MIVRIYTGDDGQTHFEDLPLPAEESHKGGGGEGGGVAWRDTFGEQLPDLEIRIWPDAGDLADIIG